MRQNDLPGLRNKNDRHSIGGRLQVGVVSRLLRPHDGSRPAGAGRGHTEKRACIRYAAQGMQACIMLAAQGMQHNAVA